MGISMMREKRFRMAVQGLFGRTETLHKNIVKAKIGKAMRMFILGGANVAIGRTMYVLQKVTLNIILDPDFFGKNIF